ncbi:MAG TPA: hypothetical protein VG125_13585 [Pirellulales bacterium]|jgi:hypothetical protein|nr:hypothetical protein [Pirellulales bacterium]
MRPPFQFRLQTAIVVISGICLLLGFLRWLGADAVIAVILLATTACGALAGWVLRRPLRGAMLGALLPVAYVLSIPVVEHLGRRARWPGATWSYCSAYESLWYTKQPFGSNGLWRGYWFWDTWCDVMRVGFGSDGATTARALIAFLVVGGPMLWVRRRKHAALVVPAGIIAAGFALATCHDFDAVFFGFTLGGLGAILTDRAKSSAAAPPG